MRDILIYRHQLFKSSEGFITQQTKYLSQHHPIFVGRKIENNPQSSNLSIKTLANYSHAEWMRHVFLRDSKPFQALLSQHQPALLHAHFGVEGVYALPLAKKLTIPLVTTFHGFDATISRKGLALSGKISWLNYLAFRGQLARQGNLFICVSHFIREKVLRLGFPEHKTLTHYVGVDVDYIQPGMPTKQNLILHVARMVEVKGTRYLLEAFSQLRKQGLEAALVIIGDGPMRNTLMAYAKSLGIADAVYFLGMLPADEVISWMQKATLFCLPSVTARTGAAEALGMVFLEAAACQLPIVATQHGGIPEAVIDGETGFLVKEKNSAELAERIAYLLQNESMCHRMGLAGRKRVESKFNLKQQTDKLEGLYLTL